MLPAQVQRVGGGATRTRFPITLMRVPKLGHWRCNFTIVMKALRHFFPTRRASIATSGVLTLATALFTGPAFALEESDRLWFVGQRALGDQMLPFAAQTLDAFVQAFPADERVGPALMAIGKARLTLGEKDAALEAFRRAQRVAPVPGAPFEARFLEAEALFQLGHYAEAHAAYDDILKNAATAPFAPAALYSLGSADVELKRPEPAIAAFRQFLKLAPEHRLASSATYQLGRALVELERHQEAIGPLSTFVTRYPDHKLIGDVRYLLGVSRLATGDERSALRDLKAFVTRHPSHALATGARKLVTDLSLRVGEKTDQYEAYVALMKETPPTAEGLIAATSVAAKLGRVRDQEAAWKRLAGAFPEHPMTSKLAFDLASAAFTRKDWNQAASFANAAAHSDDDAIKAEALLLAGEAEMKLKKFVAAAKAFEAVGVVRKVDGALRYRALAALGIAREGQRNDRGAVEAYEAVSQSSPDPALRDWARDRANALRLRLEQNPTAAPAPKSRNNS